MKVNQISNQFSTQQMTRNKQQNFGALFIKDRAINDTAVFPNAQAPIIRSAVNKILGKLEDLAKDVDMTIDVAPPDRGLDFKGERGTLIVSVQHMYDSKGKGQLTRLFENAIRLFTEHYSATTFEKAKLKEVEKPEELILEMAKAAKERL